MNGRIYDPVIARFLSPDPFVQAPDNSQGLNRYSYAWNNPLVVIDPSGYNGWVIFGAIVAIAASIASFGILAGPSIVMYAGFAAVISGAVGGFVGTLKEAEAFIIKEGHTVETSFVVVMDENGETYYYVQPWENNTAAESENRWAGYFRDDKGRITMQNQFESPLIYIDGKEYKVVSQTHFGGNNTYKNVSSPGLNDSYMAWKWKIPITHIKNEAGSRYIIIAQFQKIWIPTKGSYLEYER